MLGSQVSNFFPEKNFYQSSSVYYGEKLEFRNTQFCIE